MQCSDQTRLPFILGQRLLNLRVQLAAANQPASYKSIFNLLSASLRSGSEESRLRTEDQVQKLVTMVVKATDAELANTLKSCQVIGGARTWIGRWSIVTRVLLGCDGRNYYLTEGSLCCSSQDL